MSSHKLPISSMTKEAEVAVLAVIRACQLTKSVQNTLTVDEKVTKPDKSPVTVGDLAAQSLISLHLLNSFPEDKIVGEEDTTELRQNDGLRSKVVELVNEGFGKGRAEAGAWSEGKTFSESEILSAIDAGSDAGGGTGRLWTIDPIDGTLGFLRKEQYAVCLALIVDGQVELGVLACPNLGTNSVDDATKGVLFLARRGEGSWSRPIESAEYKQLSLPASIPSSSIRFLESVESGHSAHGIQARIGALLGVPENTSLRMDSQANLRIPTKYMGGKAYEEKIWDHASGSLLISESGGICTDMHGKPLDFSQGRTLKKNDGVVAAGRDMHAQVLEAVKQAVAEAQTGKL
ncbi:hypothetical protein QFC24_005562 [Naganishia onofrii]|uniref:Uncharacterized protein n=1 Tax=Naganishia onofrii TaxID=1851511 RepID=A0ACC2X7V6_9TREE|nr:hypothetical protein QFC24_005562 [Naganishia onofrii]